MPKSRRLTHLVGAGEDRGRIEGAERVHGARELCQRAIAHELSPATAMAREDRPEPLLAMLPQARKRAAFVPPHQAGIAHHIGCNDGG